MGGPCTQVITSCGRALLKKRRAWVRLEEWEIHSAKPTRMFGVLDVLDLEMGVLSGSKIDSREYPVLCLHSTWMSRNGTLNLKARLRITCIYFSDRVKTLVLVFRALRFQTIS